MKIGRTEPDPVVPKRLLESRVPSEVFFRLEPEIVSKNLVLAARGAESGCDAGMKRPGWFEDVIAGHTVGPDISELIEMIETPARHQGQIGERRHGYLQETRGLLGMVADEFRLRSEDLQNKRAFLSGIDAAVKKSGDNRQPGGWPQIALVINRGPFEKRAGRPDKSILVGIIHLALVIVADNESLLPPIGRPKIDIRGAINHRSVRKLSSGFGSKIVFGFPVSL